MNRILFALAVSLILLLIKAAFGFESAVLAGIVAIASHQHFPD